LVTREIENQVLHAAIFDTSNRMLYHKIISPASVDAGDDFPGIEFPAFENVRYVRVFLWNNFEQIRWAADIDYYIFD